MLKLDFKKRCGAFVLRVQTEIPEGVTALLGASGAGKSMTLRCIAGVEKPDGGVIELDGRTLFDSSKGICLPPQKRGVGLLFQNYALFPCMTLEQNLMTGLHSLPYSKTEKQARAQKAMDTFQLTGLENHLPGQLSGGQQQRAALARMLLSEPKLIMLDEPFSALDSHLRGELEQVTRQTLRAHGGTALLVSHDPVEAFRLCDRVAVMNEGTVVRQGEKQAVYKDPQSFSAARILGCRNCAAATAEQNNLNIPDWGLTLQTAISFDGKAAGAGLWTESLHPAAAGQSGTNCFTARVEEVFSEPLGQLCLLRAEGAKKPLWWRALQNPVICPGQMVTLWADPHGVLPLRED